MSYTKECANHQFWDKNGADGRNKYARPHHFLTQLSHFGEPLGSKPQLAST